MFCLSHAIVLSIVVIATLRIQVDSLPSVNAVQSARYRCRPQIDRRCTHLNVRNVVSAEGPSIIGGARNIEVEVMSIRASEIKRILTSLNANTKGLYDKEELAKLLIQVELDSLSER